MSLDCGTFVLPSGNHVHMIYTPYISLSYSNTGVLQGYTLFVLFLFKTQIVTGVKLGHMKNALFGVLTIAMYATPKGAFFI